MKVKKLFENREKKSLLSELTKDEFSKVNGGEGTGVGIQPCVLPPPPPPQKPIVSSPPVGVGVRVTF